MDQVVVHSSISVKWYVSEVYTTEARAIFGEYQAGAFNLLAPNLIYAEFGNIIWKKHVFQGLPKPEAESAIAEFRALPLVITPIADLLEEAYQIAVTYRRSVYDCLYLALSRREGCRFVTADEKLINALGGAFPNAVWIANWK